MGRRPGAIRTSDALKVTEQFHRSDHDHFETSITIDEVWFQKNVP